MSWLSKLPRWIRPPAAVRTQLEKIKGKDFLPQPIQTVLNFFGKTGEQAQSGLEKAQSDLSTAAENSQKAKQALMIIAVAVGILVVFMVLKKR